MYQALYRTYRPETFDEVLGQEHIVRILKNQIANGSTSHAYLFCGTRGTGKTTVARLLAKGVNCTGEGDRPCGQCDACESIRDGSFLDVIEIDAASNNGVDNIRELKESIKYPPVAGRKKVYIIDEVHMLSTGAYNALLKTLEEPPEYVMFILATTEPHKVLATIASRCMRLDFRRVPEATLRGGISRICEDRGITMSDDAMAIIAANADGSVRDCLSLLDQCIAGGQQEIKREDILDVLGTAGAETFIELTHLVAMHKISDALLLLDRMLADGKDTRQLMKDWLAHYRNLLISKFVHDPDAMLSMSAENVSRLKEQAARTELEQINRSIIELSKTIAEAKVSTQPRVLLELCIVKLGSSMLASQPQAQQAQASPQQIQVSPKEKPKPQPKPETESEPDEADTAADIEAAYDEPEREDATGGHDIEQLWYSIFDGDSMSRGIFNLIRTGTRPIKLEGSTLTVAAGNPVTLKYTQDNKSFLEDILEEAAGSRINIVLEDIDDSRDSAAAREERLRRASKELADKFGLNVETR